MFKYIVKIKSYKLNITKTPCSLFFFLRFSYKTGWRGSNVNVSCPHRGHTLVMLIVLPETQVAFFFFPLSFGRGLLQAKQEMKSFGPVCPR